MPRHEGILVEAIPAQHPPGAGYLVMYVERSERRPHRCEFSEKRYYKRSGDSSIMMEHFDIEDAFKRFAVPELELRYQLKHGGSQSPAGNQVFIVWIALSLINRSNVTARFPYLIVDHMSGVVGINARHDVQGLVPRQDGGSFVFEGSTGLVIHPGLERELAVVEVQCRRGARDALQSVVIHYRCGCDNARVMEGDLTIPREELLPHIPE